jgi:hypothetical protein
VNVLADRSLLRRRSPILRAADAAHVRLRELMHSTNYSNTFISVAEDCPTEIGNVPPEKQDPTIARLQYEMIAENPYRYTSDEVIFLVHAAKKEIGATDLETERAAFFSRGQACLRASALGKRYGWGIHHDSDGRVALYPQESEKYQRLSSDPTLKQVKAMKSSRK